MHMLDSHATPNFNACLTTILDALLPLLRTFCGGEYGIALGGAHAKGVDDAESDLDLYVFARDFLPTEDRERLCAQFGTITGVTSWGDAETLLQAGTDFYFKGIKIEVWFRHIDHISGIISECQQGIVKHDLVTWAVMGFYNHCTLSDLYSMRPLDDPFDVLAQWQETVCDYPPKLRRAIIDRHLRAAQFWPDNFHYKSAVERVDKIYIAGIVQQVIHNLIQVIFALNKTYFPGEKKLNITLDCLPIKPKRFTERIHELLYPGKDVGQEEFSKQRQGLLALMAEVEALAAASMDSESAIF